EPRDEGLHTYTINVDGAEMPDPNGIVFGSSGARVRNGIEIPAADQDFYALKNVPHGQIRQVRYFAKSSGAMRHIHVYTPPDYDKDVTKRFPVLYLQHGTGEDETFWGGFAGRAGLILDNLIAEGKAKSFIIVMESSQNNGTLLGGATPPPAAAPAAAPAAGGAAAPGGRGPGANPAFERVIVEDLIPFIDANFRTLANREHRGMAGLSLGGMQTRSIGLKHLELFSQIGVFSGGSVTAEEAAAIPDFKNKVKVLFVSYGSREIDAPARGGAPGTAAPAGGRGGNGRSAKSDIEALKQAGINAHFYVSPQTAHEWQTWRRSFYQFAPLAFRE
ncbi:MAG: alpha/beta hydrolase-fold protein, partial [Opitutaceae bacterium]